MNDQFDVNTDDLWSAESDSEHSQEPSMHISQSLPQTINQTELNDLIHDLNLSKDQSQILASRLKEKNLLTHGMSVSHYKSRKSSFQQFFKVDDLFVFCANVESLLVELDIENYNASKWRLFISSSNLSLKCVLLHNRNVLGSIPIAHSDSVHAEESYGEVKTVLSLLDYDQNRWVICVDLKMVNFLLGQQAGYTKYPCFLCYWDIQVQDKQWVQKDW